MSQPYRALVQQFAATLEHDRYPRVAKDFAHDLKHLTSTQSARADASLPLVRQLPHLLEGVTQELLQPLVQPVQVVAEALPWSRFYQRYGLTENFIDNFAVAEVISPDGPVLSKNMIMFLFLLGAETVYPTHWHAPEEIYFILSGNPEYQIGNKTWQPRQPGDLVHLPPFVPHAIRTGDEAMLVLQVWRGKIHEPPIFPVDADERPAHVTNAEVEEGS